MFGSILYIFDTPIVNSILVFLTVSTLLFAIKPKWMFKKDGHMKQFGFGKSKTFFTFPIVVFGVTMISYIILKVIYHSDTETSFSDTNSVEPEYIHDKYDKHHKYHKYHKHHKSSFKPHHISHSQIKKHRFVHSP